MPTPRLSNAIPPPRLSWLVVWSIALSFLTFSLGCPPPTTGPSAEESQSDGSIQTEKSSESTADTSLEVTPEPSERTSEATPETPAETKPESSERTSEATPETPAETKPEPLPDGDCNPGESRSCYNGPAGTEGIGACKAGFQSCGPDRKWGVCFGEVVPAAAEICGNKIDDDCDGKTDAEDAATCACNPGQTQSCYTGPQGTEGIGACKAGSQICLADSSWGACQNDSLPAAAEICGNKIDDDCDGKTDTQDSASCECDPNQTRPCYTGPQGTENVGECKAGIQTCGTDGRWGLCSGDALPSLELCDGKDNNCDGSIDEEDPSSPFCSTGQICSSGKCLCNATSCPNGCCDGDTCISPVSDAKCGSSGSACSTCAQGTLCSSGKCSCNAASCPNGCCDGQGLCQTGNSNTACGKHGSACVSCPTGQACDPQSQVCGCGPNSCATGCCNPQGQCVISSLATCGVGGNACTACNLSSSNVCDTGACKCGTNNPCAPGQRCNNGSCVCDPTSCPNGCCNRNTCITNRTTSLCGNQGVACSACNEKLADNCSDGSCRCGAALSCTGEASCIQGSCQCPAIQISKVLINGNPFSSTPIDIFRGSSFRVNLDYKITQLPGCPSCYDQIVIGIDTKGFGPLVADNCAYDGQPTSCPNATSGSSPNLTLQAPLVPGIYEIRAIRDLEFNCANARKKFTITDHPNAMIIARINVIPTPTCNSFESILTNLNLNGQGREITVAPGASVRVTGNYSLTQLSTCSSCIAQIVTGSTPFVGGSGGDSKHDCPYSGIPPLCPNRASGAINYAFNAPATRGIYHLRYNQSQQLGCFTAGFSGSNRLATFAVLRVQ